MTLNDSSNLDCYLEKLYARKWLNEHELANMCTIVKQILFEEPNVISISSPCTICGDIHGQFYDLKKLFRIGGNIPDTKYIFMGDYVDRGYFSVETIELLLTLKARYPDRIYLLRGNHEGREITQTYGFYDECIQKYGSTVAWRYLVDTFDCLSITAVIDNRIMCVHGGLSPFARSINQINGIYRFKEVANEGIYSDLIWSDPETNVDGFKRNFRGAGWVFGGDVTKEFEQINGLDLICRAHQVAMEGYQYFFDDALCTVWSAPNYCYRTGNLASIMKILEDGTHDFEVFSEEDADAREIPSKSSYSMDSKSHRKFFYRQGQFFIIYGDYRKKGFTISLGPNRIAFFIYLLVMLVCGIFIFYSPEHHPNLTLFYIMRVVFVIMVFSYIYTATCNAGVIIRNEDNSIENAERLEAQNYSYCSICEVYRPPHAVHCNQCGVCFENRDHHCSVIGQCIAKNNLWSFNVFIATVVVVVVYCQFISLRFFNIYSFLYHKLIKS